jgi:hypothetical protein
MKATQSFHSTNKFWAIKFFILLILTFLITTSCDLTDPKKDKPKSEGYQEDIPWPSLADSPWPMNHHDPQNTGRSNSFGPVFGKIDWMKDSLFHYNRGIAIDSDSTIYIASSQYLYAYRINGILKWKTFISNGESGSTPLVTKDFIFVHYIYGGLYAINKKGEIAWRNSVIKEISELSITKDGSILFVDADGNLNSYDKNGTHLWSFSNSIIKPKSFISISPDSKTLYLNGRLKAVLAFNIDEKRIVWDFGNSNLFGGPLIDSDGSIYLSSKSEEFNNNKPAVFCLSPDGNVKWFFPHEQWVFQENYNNHGFITMDKNGSIYFGSDTLFSINFNGKLRWKKALQISQATALVCDKENRIYACRETNSYNFELLILNDAGEIVKSLLLEGETTFSSPALGYGRLFQPTYQDFVYLVK